MPPFPPRIDPARLARLSARAALVRGPRGAAMVHAPFTGEPIGRVARMLPDDIREAAKRARLAQKAWAGRPAGERAAMLLRLHDLLLDRQDEALDLVQLETGKARGHAFEEVADSAIVARYYGVRAPGALRPRRRRGALPLLTATVEHRRPYGLVGVIVPWNYPLSLAATDALPALAAGCTVLLKPDLQTSFTALWLAERLDEVGLPEDVLQVVTGEGPELGPPIIESADYVAFTGSTKTGRIVARDAGERLVGCSLELGGKNALLVLPDADLARAVPGVVRGSFASAGQLCTSAERLFVHVSVWDAFVPAFVERTRALRLGARFDFDADMGSLVSARQLERVEAHVRDAVARGARVLAGGRARPDLGPYFYEPTILEGVTEGMQCFGEETFGPVVALYRFESLDDAVARANATPYGLNASVWTRDPRAARDLAARLAAGMVNVNEGYAAGWASVDSPMGGMKDSGLGRRHGLEGLLKYTEAQTVAVQRGLAIGPPARLGHAGWARLLTRLLRLVRWVPGLR